MPRNTKHDFTNARPVTIDGIEGDYARVELPNGTTEDWHVRDLPEGAKEGDVLQVHHAHGRLVIRIDHEETQVRRAQAQQELTALNSAAPAGEIDL